MKRQFRGGTIERIIGHMEATEAELQRFGEAFERYRADRPRAWLAEQLSVTGETVRKWGAGETEPPRASVFAVERALAVAPGTLSRLLGYLPLDAIAAPCSTLDAIDSDDDLDEHGRAAMRAVYYAVTQQA